MALTVKQLRQALDPDEPDYDKAAQQFGAEALPLLEALVQSNNYMLASKAAYLAGLIDTPKARTVIETAARSPSNTVRIAAASVVSNLSSPVADKILVSLLSDPDAGVRRVALESVKNARPEAIMQRIRWISRDDPERDLRHLAAETLSRVTRTRRRRPPMMGRPTRRLS